MRDGLIPKEIEGHYLQVKEAERRQGVSVVNSRGFVPGPSSLGIFRRHRQ
jgi:hypothetical protein